MVPTFLTLSVDQVTNEGAPADDDSEDVVVVDEDVNRRMFSRNFGIYDSSQDIIDDWRRAKAANGHCFVANTTFGRDCEITWRAMVQVWLLFHTLAVDVVRGGSMFVL